MSMNEYKGDGSDADLAILRSQQLDAEPMLRWFEYSHLPEHLQGISILFHVLAHELVARAHRNAERTVALRKLLEAKDAAVRAALG